MEFHGILTKVNELLTFYSFTFLYFLWNSFLDSLHIPASSNLLKILLHTVFFEYVINYELQGENV